MSLLENLNTQNVATVNRTLEEQARRIVTKEKGNAARILYCGPNNEGNGVVLYRLVELKYGEPFLEKVNFTAKNQIVSNLNKIGVPTFHKIQDPFREENKKKNSTDYLLNLMTVFRPLETGNGLLRYQNIFDNRYKGSFSTPFNYYLYLKMQNYSKK